MEPTDRAPQLSPTLQSTDAVDAASYRPCRFTGTSSEYFKIWIVNIALMLVTLGIYSAWAKVRRNQYVYGNTYFEDSSFVYHADPRSILIGRLIVFVPFILITALSYYNPVVGNAIIYGVFFIAPFFIIRAIKFRWRITTYRGVSFRFDGTTKESYVIYLLWPIAAALAMMLIYPLSVQRRKKWLVSKSYFGDQPFNFSGETRTIFWIYTKVVLAVAAVAGFTLWFGLPLLEAQVGSSDTLPILEVAIAFAILVPLILTYPYIQSRVTNYVWDHTSIRNTTFKGTLKARRLVFLYATNLLAIVVSLGLLIPWSLIRMTRYRVESVHYALRDSIDDVVGPGARDRSALGEETFGMFDMDIG